MHGSGCNLFISLFTSKDTQEQREEGQTWFSLIHLAQKIFCELLRPYLEAIFVSGLIIKEVNLRAAALLRSSRFSKVFFVSYHFSGVFYDYHFIPGRVSVSHRSPGITMNAQKINKIRSVPPPPVPQTSPSQQKPL